MKLLYRYNLLLAGGIYLLLFMLLLPFYKQVFDVDGVGYSLVAQHLAEGNFNRAINGFWSPLHSWIIAPFIKTGIPVELLFFYSNAAISLVLLWQLKKFFRHFQFTDEVSTVLLLTSVIILLQFSFYELAADILLLPFLMGYLLFVVRSDFFSNYKVQIACGLLTGFAYLAKTYALPFTVLIHLSLFLWHYYRERIGSVKTFLCFIFPLLLVITPWIILISSKYGMFTIGNASRLNLSWFLKGSSVEGELFHQPIAAGSPGWWEDPSYFKGAVVHLFTSMEMFVKQIRVFFYNITIYIKTLAEFSAFMPAVILGFVIFLFRREEVKMQKIALFVLIFPAGYLLTYVDGRYLWIFQLALLPVGWWMLQSVITFFQFRKTVINFLFLIYVLSFLLQPVNILKDYAVSEQWKEIRELTTYFTTNKISGNFTANKKSPESQVVAYLSKTSFYQLTKPDVSFEELHTAIGVNRINYLLFYYDSAQEKEAIINLFRQKGYRAAEVKTGVLIFSVP
jgi:hypothetical protein